MELWNIKIDNQIFRIPQLKSNFPLVFNEHVDSVVEEVRVWLKEINIFPSKELGEKYIKGNCQWLSSSWCAFFNRQDTIEFIKLVDLMIIVDDLWIETGVYTKKEIDTLFDPKSNQNRIGKEITKIYDYFKNRSKREIIDLHLFEMKNYIFSTIVNESKFNGHLSFQEYFQLRSQDIALKATFTSCLLSGEVNFPIELLETALFQKFFEIIAVPFSLINDIYSFKKECKMNDFKNYVKILVFQNGNNFQLALDKAEEIYTEYLEKYQDICQEILANYPNDEAVSFFILNSNIIISSGIYFFSTLARYDDTHCDDS